MSPIGHLKEEISVCGSSTGHFMAIKGDIADVQFVIGKRLQCSNDVQVIGFNADKGIIFTREKNISDVRFNSTSVKELLSDLNGQEISGPKIPLKKTDPAYLFASILLVGRYINAVKISEHEIFSLFPPSHLLENDGEPEPGPAPGGALDAHIDNTVKGTFSPGDNKYEVDYHIEGDYHGGPGSQDPEVELAKALRSIIFGEKCKETTPFRVKLKLKLEIKCLSSNPESTNNDFTFEYEFNFDATISISSKICNIVNALLGK